MQEMKKSEVLKGDIIKILKNNLGIFGVLCIFIGVSYGSNLAFIISGSLVKNSVEVSSDLILRVQIGLTCLGVYMIFVDLIKRLK